LPPTIAIDLDVANAGRSWFVNQHQLAIHRLAIDAPPIVLQFSVAAVTNRPLDATGVAASIVAQRPRRRHGTPHPRYRARRTVADTSQRLKCIRGRIAIIIVIMVVVKEFKDPVVGTHDVELTTAFQYARAWYLLHFLFMSAGCHSVRNGDKTHQVIHIAVKTTWPWHAFCAILTQCHLG
jgi:hypothetical protein